MISAADGAAKLILMQGALRSGIEVVPGIEGVVAQEIVRIAMKLVGSTLGHDVDHCTSGPAVFGVRCIGQQAKFLDGVERRNDGGSVVEVVLDISPIHTECVARFALAID